jgi:hypothetical protein
MHDHFAERYGSDAFDDPRNWVEGQFKPRKRIARDREGVSVPMQLMDHRPGYRFADDDARVAAAEAYDERSARLSNAWRRDSASDHRGATPTLDEGRKAAEAAYRERSRRLQEGWRQK